MAGIVRALFVAALSVAAGSWVGAGRPEASALRVGLGTDAPKVTPPPVRDVVPDDPALPHAADPSLVPSFAPWPRMNPEASIAKAWIVAEGRHKQPGDGRRLVTLTFDDGPTLETTPAVLRLLGKHRVRATFFVIGRYLDPEEARAEQARLVLQRIVAAGHLVGNHTYDHVDLSIRSPEQIIDQIDRGAASIERVTGRRPILFRPPYGKLDAFGERAVRERNLDVVLWNVETRDMQRDDVDEMFHDLVRQLDYKQGGIVLLHDVKQTTLPVLRRLLEFLRDRPYDPASPDRGGYEIVDLPEYLRAAAASPLPEAEPAEG